MSLPPTAPLVLVDKRMKHIVPESVSESGDELSSIRRHQ